MQLPDGIIAVLKQDCPTCVLVDPVLKEIESQGLPVTVYVQDEPGFTTVRSSTPSASTSRPCRP